MEPDDQWQELADLRTQIESFIDEQLFAIRREIAAQHTHQTRLLTEETAELRREIADNRCVLQALEQRFRALIPRSTDADPPEAIAGELHSSQISWLVHDKDTESLCHKIHMKHGELEDRVATELRKFQMVVTGMQEQVISLQRGFQIKRGDDSNCGLKSLHSSGGPPLLDCSSCNMRAEALRTMVRSACEESARISHAFAAETKKREQSIDELQLVVEHLKLQIMDSHGSPKSCNNTATPSAKGSPLSTIASTLGDKPPVSYEGVSPKPDVPKAPASEPGTKELTSDGVQVSRKDANDDSWSSWALW